jgi:hypothetical protein
VRLRFLPVSLFWQLLSALLYALPNSGDAWFWCNGAALMVRGGYFADS